MSGMEIGWNGIRFSMPPPWEVMEIGARYLKLAAGGKPVLEIKWERGERGFSPAEAFRRLPARRKETIRETSLPDEWKPALAGFTAAGFTWEAGREHGRGAILSCPGCGLVTLIHFFAGDGGDLNCLTLLSSFRDHSPDSQVLWSLYDIRAVLPGAFRLIGHRFEAGFFELQFELREGKITLYRWAPASAILRGTDLVHFAVTRFPQMDPKAVKSLEGHGEALQWERGAPAGLAARLRDRLAREPFFQWFRFWHLPGKNRILAVSAKGERSPDAGLLERICSRYESI